MITPNKMLWTPYHRVVLHIIPRILTNLDRDKDSPTYGCLDRNFWHYKTHDYSSALLQQSMITLALVYKNNFLYNIYYEKESIRDYAIASIDYCTKIQHKDGSFDEYWAGEHSIPSTSFTLYAICETCDLLGYLPEDVVKCIRKAVGFLQKHTETEALNQETSSCAAIKYAAKLLNEEGIHKIADEKFHNLVKKQKSEGWFDEYNGLDIGYLTVNLDYMVRYYELSGNEAALLSAKKMLYVIRYFIHPDGSLGGEYCTRNTEYFLPYGIEYLKNHCELAGSIIGKLMGYLTRDSYLNLSLDERYILHYVNHSFVKALLIYENVQSTKKLPCETEFDLFLEESKIYIKSTKNYYFICNMSKGGVFKVMNKKTLECSTDCGYRIRHKGNLYVNEWPNPNEFTFFENGVKVNSYFTKTKLIKQSSFKLLLLRVLSIFFGYKAVIMTKKLLIFNQNTARDMYLIRYFYFEDEKVIVKDSIDIGHKDAKISLSPGLSVRHTASSRFFQINSLNNIIQRNEKEIHHNADFERILDFKSN